MFATVADSFSSLTVVSLHMRRPGVSSPSPTPVHGAVYAPTAHVVLVRPLDGVHPPLQAGSAVCAAAVTVTAAVAVAADGGSATSGATDAAGGLDGDDATPTLGEFHPSLEKEEEKRGNLKAGVPVLYL